MKPLLAFLVMCVLAFPVAFAIPGPPASVWFEQNESTHYDSGAFSVNWMPPAPAADSISDYVIYVHDAATDAFLFDALNTSALGFEYSSATNKNYTFKIAARNTTGDIGPNIVSDWMYVYSTPPSIEFKEGNLPLHAYTKDPIVPIYVGFSGSDMTKPILENENAELVLGTEKHDVRVVFVSGPNTAYLSVDGGVSQAVAVNALYTISGVQIYVDQIYFGSEDPSWVQVSLYDSRISIKLNWNGINLTDQFSYFGTFWNASVSTISDGDYDYYVQAADFLGNTARTETRTITYDTTQPQVALVSPIATMYNSTYVPLIYTVDDASPVSCWYEYNSVNTTIPGCGDYIFEALINTSTLVLWAGDEVGNQNSASVTFSVNDTLQQTSVPIIISTVPSNNTVLDAPSLTGNTTDLRLVTNRIVECKYSDSNTSFETMTRFSSTNSTSHSTTIPISSGATYGYFLRCNSPQGNMTPQDYKLVFSTAAFKAPILVDPSGAVLKNGSLAVDMVVGNAQDFRLLIKNRAFYNISGLNASFSGSGAPYVRVELPEALPANSTGYFNMSLASDTGGIFSSMVSISGDNYTIKFPVNMTVFSDYLPELNTLKSTRQNLSTQLYTLQFNGADVATLISEAENLQLDVNDAISLYNSGYYSEGMDKLLDLKDRITVLSAAVADAEANAVPRGDGDVNVTPDDNGTVGDFPDAPEEGNSTLIWYVLGGIILVIIAVVLATSVMPEDESDKRKNTGILR